MFWVSIVHIVALLPVRRDSSFVSVHTASIPYARDEHVLQFRMPVHLAADGEELDIFLTCFTLHASSCRKMRRSPHLEATTLKDSGVSVSAHDHAGLC